MKKIALTLIACLTVTILCMGASGGCGSNLHKANVAAGTIAASLHAAAVANHTNTLESDEERTAVANYIAQAATANDNFIGVLTQAQQNGNKLDMAAATEAFQKLVTQVNQLNSLGILHLKSTQAQAVFGVVVTSINANLTVIQALIIPAATSENLPAPKPSRPWFAIALTAEEIEELVSLAVAAGSALLPKLMALKGESDPQILIAASQDDAAAIAIAESDGASKPAS